MNLHLTNSSSGQPWDITKDSHTYLDSTLVIKSGDPECTFNFTGTALIENASILMPLLYVLAIA